MTTSPLSRQYETTGFAAGTLIRCPSGVMRIEEIHAGDSILARRRAHDETNPRHVDAAVQRAEGHLRAISYCVAGAEERSEELFTTDGQLFWDVQNGYSDSEQGWTAAQDLDGGCQLLLLDGRRAFVLGNRTIHESEHAGFGIAMALNSGFDPTELCLRIDVRSGVPEVLWSDAVIYRGTDAMEASKRLGVAVFALELGCHLGYFAGVDGVWTRTPSR